MNPHLLPYVTLVDFLADYLGENAEVVLHDLSDLAHSIVKIRNNQVSGRNVGDPATDWVIRHLQQRGDKDYYHIYRGMSKDYKTLKSSSLFIFDNESTVIGVLCINLEVEGQLRYKEFLDGFLRGLDSRDFAVKEHLGQTVDEMIDTSLQNTLLRLGHHTSRLKHAEKMQVIEQIDSDGIFLLKGAVGKVAAKLKISEPTVYRCLSRLPRKAADKR